MAAAVWSRSSKPWKCTWRPSWLVHQRFTGRIIKIVSQDRVPRRLWCRSSSTSLLDRVHQRFEEQNLEPPRYFQWTSGVGLVAPFTVLNEACGIIPHIFYVKVLALFALENLNIRAARWRGGTVFRVKTRLFSDAGHGSSLTCV